jgi:sugar O-acyltransferase (sialic acid O-acetyltransferase NeuD family)
VTHRKQLAVLGASGHGKVVSDAALLAGWESVVFFDDAWPTVSAIGPWPVVGATAELLGAAAQYGGAVVAIGDNSARLKKQRELAYGRVILASIIHPASVVSRFAEIGAGSVVFAGAVVNPFARLGPGCIVNTCASIDHDCELDAGVHVSPGARLGGRVRVGEAAWIGIGAAVKQGISIGSGVVIGAGAVVVSDVADGLTVVGVPARPLRC